MKIEYALPDKGRFLMLGYEPKLFTMLRDRGWEGICVFPPNTFKRPLDDLDFDGTIMLIEGWLQPEGHIVRLTDGIWIKPITVADIFNQFGNKPFDLIAISENMIIRKLWETEQVQVHMPRFHLLKDDGWNQPVEAKANSLGYNTMKCEDEWLLLTRG